MSYIRRRVLSSGAVRYYPVIVHRGRCIHLGGYNRKRDALTRLRDAEGELAAGTLHRPTACFGEFADKWLEAVRHDVHPNTHHTYRLRLRRLECFANVPLEKITREKIEAFKQEAGRTLAPSSVNAHLQVLGAVLNRAVAWGYIESNPAKQVSRVRNPHKEMNHLTPAEVQRFLSAATPTYYPLFLTATMTGLRMGELLRLTRQDVDRGLLIVRGEVKSASSRRAVELTPLNLEVLEPLEGRLFPFSPAQVRRAFKATLKRAGLREMRFHDLRHTYVTLMISLGVNIKFLQHQLGHSKISTTLDTYGHLIPQAGRGAAELDALIFDPAVIPFPTQTGGTSLAGQGKRD